MWQSCGASGGDVTKGKKEREGRGRKGGKKKEKREEKERGKKRRK
jgi:hypothetical protein